MPGEGVQLGAVGTDVFELELFGLGESFPASEDPPGDGPGRGGRAESGRGDVRLLNR